MRADGSVVSWGWNEDGVMTPPPDLYGVAGISAGAWHNVARKFDGTVVAWGRDSCGATDVSSVFGNLYTVSAGANHNLALSGWPEQSYLVLAGSTWKYLDAGVDPGDAWFGMDFDDDQWSEGPAQLGYGDGDEATILDFGPDSHHKAISSFFRQRFTVTDTHRITDLRVDLMRDDGAVVYLNGVEIIRNNLPPGPISPDTLATASVGGTDEGTFFGHIVHPDLLREGRNVIAAEVHQVHPASSDLTFDLALSAQRSPQPPNSPPTVRLATPKEGACFVAPAQIRLAALAQDPDGFLTIETVEFFAGDRSLGVVSNLPTTDPLGPFVLPWSEVVAGDYVLTAQVRDDQGGIGTSDPVRIRVRPGPGLDHEVQPPTR
jgi:hypothetical protein